MSMDIRLIDAETAEVIYSTSVVGESRDVSIAGGGFLSGASLIGGLSSYANTPMEKAIRSCINAAVEEIAMRLPAEYYRA